MVYEDGLDVNIYSGNIYEILKKKDCLFIYEILKEVDILIDGLFI